MIFREPFRGYRLRVALFNILRDGSMSFTLTSDCNNALEHPCRVILLLTIDVREAPMIFFIALLRFVLRLSSIFVPYFDFSPTLVI